ncbi:Patched domain-containing protein 3 [Holothuria leucospilota]|uniref:Patched domain-containing protein 3 n=1 Tax=Holothuria leucospilota TaxID=206669 RepID=A0A9Q1CDS2_HOLLE|nr:Patched domain-containing protein 3 [Holothuria leucospilota]
MFKTDYIERALRRLFISYSRLLCRYPFVIAISSLLIAAGLGSGFAFFSYASGTEDLFTPQESQARNDRNTIADLFPVDFDSFLPDRVIKADQRQLSVILSAVEGDNILNFKVMAEILSLNAQIISTKISVNETEFTFEDVCSRWNGECIENPIFQYLGDQYNNGVFQPAEDEFRLPFPNILYQGNTINIETFLGGNLVQDGFVIQAKYLLVPYFLREGQDDDLSELWINELQTEILEGNYSFIDVAVFPSDGLDQAQRSLTRIVVPFFSITYTVLITFAITSCLMFRDNVQSKTWLAYMGVLSASLAIVSALGLLSYCKVPFNQVATSVPFLILGIGLDDMFILISSWRKTYAKNSVEERMEDTLADAGVSITITSLTDFLAFLIGSISPLPAIKVFCLYAGVAVLFDLFYQITLFGSSMVLFGRLEAANRHSWTCLRVRPRSDPKNSKAYNICCSGGASKKVSDEPTVHLAIKFFQEYYSRLFTHFGTIISIIFLYLVYLGFSVYGCTNIGEGLQLKNLAEQGSSIHTFLRIQADEFNDPGPSVSVAITEELPYWELSVREKLLKSIDCFHSSEFIKSHNYTQCWFVDFYEFLDGNQIVMPDRDSFMTVLRDQFLTPPQSSRYNLDINFEENGISSSRCIITTQNVETAKKQGEMMLALRDLATSASDLVGVEIVVFSPGFPFYEQYIIIIPQTIQTLGIAVASMLVVSLILIPNPLVAILVSVSVISILTGVIGFMTFWGVSLESISLINLVLCIGFSVDFTAHVAYLFASSDSSQHPSIRVSSTLAVLGYPILQSAVSTILGVAILLVVPSYIFQTFAKIIILVMIFGLLHGLLFVPVAMVVFARVTFQVAERDESKVWDHGHENQAYNDSMSPEPGN